MCCRVAQEVQLEKLKNKADKQAKVAAKLAAAEIENVPLPVQPVYPVPTGLGNAAVVLAVPCGSPVAMQPFASPLQPVPVMLSPGGV